MKEKNVKERSLPLAIGLNLLFPGIGYIYMGRWVLGILACLLVVGIYATSDWLLILPTWIGMNIIMVIDMMILSSKNKKKIAEATTKKCPSCAEVIQREAKVCRFCNTKLETDNG